VAFWFGLKFNAAAEQQRQKGETGEQKKSRQVPAVAGLLIPRIARLSNHVATVLIG
jgi:hypothetical protein